MLDKLRGVKCFHNPSLFCCVKYSMFVLKSNIEAQRLQATKTKPQGNLSKNILSQVLKHI